MKPAARGRRRSDGPGSGRQRAGRRRGRRGRGRENDPGRRSTEWIKIKPRLRQEFVVGGWLSGQGSREAGLGSLILGTYDDDQLVFAGRAGSGLSGQSQREWLAVKVAGRDKFGLPIGVSENQRVVGHTVNLRLHNANGVGNGIAACAVDLRNTAKRVRILHLSTVRVRKQNL